MIYIILYALIFIYQCFRHLPKANSIWHDVKNEHEIPKDQELSLIIELIYIGLTLVYIIFLLIFCIPFMILDIYDIIKKFKNE